MAHPGTRVFGSPLTGGNTPKPEIVRRILDSHEIDPAGALMIGDRRHDIEGARANGVGAIAVRWGYGDPGEPEAADPDFAIDHPEEIARIAAGSGSGEETADGLAVEPAERGLAGGIEPAPRPGSRRKVQ